MSLIPGHAKNDGVGANLGNKDAGVELLVDCSYLQFGGRNMVSEMAILVARKPMEGLGLIDRTEWKGVMLRKRGVNKGIALCTSINHCSCLNELGAYSKFYWDNGTTLMQLVFT